MIHFTVLDFLRSISNMWDSAFVAAVLHAQTPKGPLSWLDPYVFPLTPLRACGIMLMEKITTAEHFSCTDHQI